MRQGDTEKLPGLGVGPLGVSPVRAAACQSQLNEDACFPEKSILSPLEVFPGWAEVAFGSLIYDLYKHP